ERISTAGGAAARSHLGRRIWAGREQWRLWRRWRPSFSHASGPTQTRNLDRRRIEDDARHLGPRFAARRPTEVTMRPEHATDGLYVRDAQGNLGVLRHMANGWDVDLGDSRRQTVDLGDWEPVDM